MTRASPAPVLPFLVLALTLVACDGAPAQDDAMVRSSDPELRAATEALLPELARRAGLELRETVRVERRSRAALESYLRAKLDEELSPEEADHLESSYEMLGLLPPNSDIRELLLSVYLEQVAGFYDPDSTALFVLEDQPVEALESVLVHELVHAVQDQHAPLDSLTAPELGNDRRTAAQAAIEGHATLVMLELAASRAQGDSVDVTDIPDFSRAIRPALQAMVSQYPALAGAPPILQQSLLFPYLEGVGFVQALWRSQEGRPPPFGDRLPHSTEQVLRPERFLVPEPDVPTPLALRVSGEGVRTLYEEGLGQLETEVFLEELLGPDARPLARGWDGDRYALLETRDGARALAWGMIWDDTASRDAFYDAVVQALPDLSSEARLERREVEGRPGLLLTVGPTGPVEVVPGS